MSRENERRQGGGQRQRESSQTQEASAGYTAAERRAVTVRRKVASRCAAPKIQIRVRRTPKSPDRCPLKRTLEEAARLQPAPNIPHGLKCAPPENLRFRAAVGGLRRAADCKRGRLQTAVINFAIKF